MRTSWSQRHPSILLSHKQQSHMYTIRWHRNNHKQNCINKLNDCCCMVGTRKHQIHKLLWNICIRKLQSNKRGIDRVAASQHQLYNAYYTQQCMRLSNAYNSTSSQFTIRQEENIQHTAELMTNLVGTADRASFILAQYWRLLALTLRQHVSVNLLQRLIHHLLMSDDCLAAHLLNVVTATPAAAQLAAPVP